VCVSFGCLDMYRSRSAVGALPAAATAVGACSRQAGHPIPVDAGTWDDKQLDGAAESLSAT